MRSNLTHLVSRRSKYQTHAVSAACCGFWHFVLCAKGVSLLRALSMFRWPSCCHFSLSLSSKVLLSLLPSGVMRPDLIYIPISLHVRKYWYNISITLHTLHKGEHSNTNLNFGEEWQCRHRNACCVKFDQKQSHLHWAPCAVQVQKLVHCNPQHRHKQLQQSTTH